MQFLDELDSPPLLQPRLLQLRAVYAQNDGYLRDGYHLRWMPHSTFGFPRRGFLLSARESPSPELGGSENMVETSLDSGASWSPAYTLDSGEQVGVRLSRPDGSSPGPLVRSGLTLEFVDETGRPTPAATVAILVSSGSGEGATPVKAIARADGRLGQEKVIVSEVDNNFGNLSPVESGRVVSLSGGHIASVTVWAPEGGELEINNVRWLPANRYANSDGWQPFERFLLPYDGSGVEHYPQQNDVYGEAEDRLRKAVPKNRPPWQDEATSNSPTFEDLKGRYLGDEDSKLGDLQDLFERILSFEVKGNGKPQGDFPLKELHSDGWTLNAGGQSDYSGKVEKLNIRAVQFLIAASTGTPFANLLGLAHFLDLKDDDSRDSQYDFKISAVYPRRWWRKSLNNIFPSLRDGGAIVPPIPDSEDLSGNDAASPREIAEANPDFFRVVSLATNVGPDTPLTKEAPKPRDLTVDLQDAPGKDPIPVEAVVSWSLPKKEILDWEEMQDWEAPVVGYMAERADSKGKILLDGRERNPDQSGDETDEEVRPRLIDLDENKHELRDAGLRVDDEDEDTTTTWKVYLMDFWGRWSDFESVTDTVKDNTPPPPPSGLTAEFESDLDTPGSTNDNPMVLEFKYGKGVVNQARDLSSFEIYLEGGNVESGSEEPVGEDPDSPDYTVTVEISQTDGEFKLQSAEVDEDGVSATVVNPNERSTNEEDDQPNEEKARRVRVEGITGSAAEEETYHWHTTASVRAVDDADNKSKSATGVATFVESVVEKVPAPEVDDIEYTTWPDADDLGWWRCEWDPNAFEPGARIQVLRTSGARLLAEAGKDRDDVSGSLADELRGLASKLKYRHAFAPDHPESYDVQRGHHDVAIEASSRDLHLVLVMPTGPTGNRAAWPGERDDLDLAEKKERFAVIAARSLKPVPQPRLTAHSENMGVHLRLSVAQDIELVRVWRTTESGVDDLRKMRPLPPIDVQARGSADEDDSPEDDESSMRKVLSQVDEDVEPSTWYAYRAVAEAKDGRRSAPTEPVWVQTD